MTVIAISGVPGAGSSTVGRLLAEQLHLQFFSVGEFYKKRSHAKTGAANQTDQALRYMQDQEGSSADVHINLDEMQQELGRSGNIVIDGKLSIHMLQGLWNVSVWLTGTYEARAERVHERDHVSHDEAVEKIKQREKTERLLWMKLYEFDYFEQEHEATLPIDTTHKTPQEIVALIVQYMSKHAQEK